MKPIKSRKVVIIGNGAVGSTAAFALVLGHAVSSLVIIDTNTEKAMGDVLDMADGMSFLSPKEIYVGNYEDCEDAQVIVITAGAAQKVGETRLDLLKKNASIMKSITDSIKPHLNPKTVVVVVSNPCDVLTYLVYKELGLPSKQVMGSGTVLDTSRLKTALADVIGIDSRNVHAYVVGEHGDSEVVAWSTATVAGLGLIDYCERHGNRDAFSSAKLASIAEGVKNAAYEIIAKKGATNYAVALAISKILNVILNNENHVLTVSTYLEDEFGGNLNDVYISLPCVVNAEGVDYVIRPAYTVQEQRRIIESGTIVRGEIDKVLNG